MNEDFTHQAKVMKAFCDENRLRILSLLRGGETCACNLLEHLDIGQPALSYHMKILVESGVVESRACGKWMHYSLSERGSAEAIDMLRATLAQDASGKARGERHARNCAKSAEGGCAR